MNNFPKIIPVIPSYLEHWYMRPSNLSHLQYHQRALGKWSFDDNSMEIYFPVETLEQSSR